MIGKKGAAAAAAVLAFALASAFCVSDALQPPVREAAETASPPTGEAARGEETLPAENPDSARRDGVYTLLLAGRDDASGCTDTILLARLDTRQHRLDLVSIPRDTLVNLDWKVRKLNAVYAGTVNGGGDALEGLRRELRRLCGFSADACAVIDLELFAQAVDLLGGVEFELTQAMDYDDEAQDLHIHLPEGRRRLSGREAEGLVRYRAGYVNGDLDRVEVQQRFMEAALSQFLSLGSVPKLPELAKLLAAHMDTDLTASNLLWLARQLLLCSREDLHFATMPNEPVTVAGLSYTLVRPEEWLAMINERLNPFAAPIRLEDLDLVYRDDGGFHATSGVLRGPEYYRQ